MEVTLCIPDELAAQIISEGKSPSAHAPGNARPGGPASFAEIPLSHASRVACEYALPTLRWARVCRNANARKCRNRQQKVHPTATTLHSAVLDPSAASRLIV